MTSRGIRNANPGNVDHNPRVKWQGELPYDASIEKRFCRFKAPEWGIRAIVKILISYSRRGINTVREIINTWAPPSENDTRAYVEHVAKLVGVHPDDEIDVTDTDYTLPLVKAIITHENGEQPYSDAIILKGINLALGKD